MKFPNLLKFTMILFVMVLLITAMRPLAPLAPLGATINVNIFIDEYNDTATGCSLREAVQSANDNADFGGCTPQRSLWTRRYQPGYRHLPGIPRV